MPQKELPLCISALWMSYGAVPKDAELITPDKPLFIGLAATCEKAVIKFSQQKKARAFCLHLEMSAQNTGVGQQWRGISTVSKARQES